MTDAPKVGQVVEHYFLWQREHAEGLAEGRKSRPCLILIVEVRAGLSPRVTLVPITSQSPRGESAALAIPRALNARIGLDPGRDAWLVIDEANVFVWPGFDLVPQSNGGFVRGTVTAGFFQQVRSAVLVMHGAVKFVRRDG